MMDGWLLRRKNWAWSIRCVAKDGALVEHLKVMKRETSTSCPRRDYVGRSVTTREIAVCKHGLGDKLSRLSANALFVQSGGLAKGNDTKTACLTRLLVRMQHKMPVSGTWCMS